MRQKDGFLRSEWLHGSVGTVLLSPHDPTEGMLHWRGRRLGTDVGGPEV